MTMFKPVKHFIQQSLCLPLLTLSMVMPASAAAPYQAIDYVDAEFAVSYNQAAAGGTAKLTIRQQQHHYDVNFNIQHSLLKARQQAHFSAEGCDITPQSYSASTEAAFKGKSQEHLGFNWADKIATRQHNKDGDTSFQLTQAYYDPMSLYFKARCDLMAGKQQLSYPLIYKGKESTHRYHVVGTEKVNTGMGEFEALVVERQRRNKNRRTTFYVAPALDYLIVKIEHRESSLATVSMTLKRMDYQLQ